MIEGDTGGPRMRQKAVIINRIRPGLHLLKDVRRHDRALHDLPRDLHAGDMYAAILVRGQIIRLDHWFCHRVRAGDMNESTAFRAKLARPEGDPGEIVELPLFRIGKAGIGDVVLDIRPGQTFAAPHKTAKHAGRHRQHPATGKQIAQNLAGKAEPVGKLVDRDICLQPPGQARDVMVMEILADPGKGMARRNAVLGQQIGIADAGQLQDLWRLDGAGRQDDLASGLHRLVTAMPAEGNARRADTAFPFEFNAGDMRMGDHPQIGPPPRRIEIGFLRREPHAVLLRDLIGAEAVLAGAVIVGIVRVATTLGSLDQQVERRIAVAKPADIQRPATAMIFIILAGEFAMFGAPEIGKHVGIAPAAVATLRPAVIVGLLAADIEHRVDRRRAAKHLASRLFDPPVVAGRIGLGLEHPVHRRVDHRLDVTGRNVDQRVAVLAASFKKHHAHRRIFAQPRGKHTSGGPAANNHIICSHHAPIVPSDSQRRNRKTAVPLRMAGAPAGGRGFGMTKPVIARRLCAPRSPPARPGADLFPMETLPMETLLFFLFAAGLSGGFVNGLAGFGTALFSLGWLLQVMPPREAVAIALVCSLVTGVPGVWQVRAGINLRSLALVVLPALAGIPLGIMALNWIEASSLSVFLGGMLLVYGGYFLFRRTLPTIEGNWRVVEGGLGFVGGALGAMAGLSGALLSMWLAMRPWPKTVQRAILQPYNMVVLMLATMMLALDGGFTMPVLVNLALTLPASLVGAIAGLALFRRLSDMLYRRLLIVLMLASGLSLLVRTLVIG